jgi:hypothetical protein
LGLTKICLEEPYKNYSNPYGPDETMHNSYVMVDLTGKSSLPEFCNEQKWFHNDKLSIPSYPYWFFMAKNVYLESKNGNLKNEYIKILIKKWQI